MRACNDSALATWLFIIPGEMGDGAVVRQLSYKREVAVVQRKKKQ